MENLQKSPCKAAQSPIQVECKTPVQDFKNDSKSLSSSSDSRKTNTPDRLQVPKAFKYPERYRSPTDQMVSPVTKGILARNRKVASLLPPSLNHPKQQVQDGVAQEVVSFKIEI
ncbi:hydroxyproline-rich glycoprotein family protein [Euphorbia peplus]|nr:hydroxyproline-rich glycoprotein family protein [Euphorbia peplus]